MNMLLPTSNRIYVMRRILNPIIISGRAVPSFWTFSGPSIKSANHDFFICKPAKVSPTSLPGTLNEHCDLTSSLMQGGAQEEDEDLFADDGEDEDAAKEEMRQRAADARAAAKSGGPPAKTNIVLDVKGKYSCRLPLIPRPWSSETNWFSLYSCAWRLRPSFGQGVPIYVALVMHETWCRTGME